MYKKSFIVQTKIQSPGVKGRILYRRRLLEMLMDNLDKKLILVCADAGYGKTTLLVQLCTMLGNTCIFYRLDAGDNDPACFFSHLVCAVRKTIANFGERVDTVITRTRNTEILVGTLINEFVEKTSDHYYIILDDYHYLQRNRSIAAQIDYLLRNLPANLHLIIASRTTPPINMSYFRAKQELFTIDKKHLRFDLPELRSLLIDAYRLKFSEREIIRIADQTQGWITAIHLIVQIIDAAGLAETKNAPISNAATGEEIFNYFAEEVFNAQTPDIKNFLMKTSIIDTLTPGICNELLKTRSAGKVLSVLEAEHVFISRIDGKYVYHPLFKEFLLQNLKEHTPKQGIARLHDRAARYYYRTCNYSPAVDHFLTAGKYKQAARILIKHGPHWEHTGQYTTLINLLDRFPKSIIRADRCLKLKKAHILHYLGSDESALKLLESVLARSRSEKDVHTMIDGYILRSSIYLALFDPFTASNSAQQAHRLIKHAKSSQKAVVFMMLAQINQQQGMYDRAGKYIGEALRIAKKRNDTSLEIDILANRAYLYWSAACYGDAEEIYTELFSRFKHHIADFRMGKLYCNAALISLYNNNLVRALEYLENGERIAYQYNDPWKICYLLFVKGEFCLYQGDFKKAVEHFEQSLAKSKSISYKVVDHHSLINIASALLELGRMHAARSVVKKLEPILTERNSPAFFIDYLVVKSKIAQHDHHHTQALKLLLRALDIARKLHHAHKELSVRYEMCRYYMNKNRTTDAVDNLKTCLAIAGRKSLDAFLVRAGRLDLKPLEFGLEHGIAADYLIHLLSHIETEESARILTRYSHAMKTYDLECRYFGTFQVKNSRGRVVMPAWRTRVTRSLCAMLVLKRRHGCSADHLIDTFWPKKGAQQASRSLQVEISHLRNLLKALVKTAANISIITFSSRTYTIIPSILIKSDVQTFDNILQDAASQHAVERSQVTALYERALALYTGDFCADLSDAWCEEIRLHYKEKVLEILKVLGQHYCEARQFEKSLSFFHRAVRLDKYDQLSHTGIIRCYSRLGRKKAVQNHYRIFERTMLEAGISQLPPEAVSLYKRTHRIK